MIESVEYGKHGITLKLTGIITSKELKELNTSIINRQDFGSFKYQLWIIHSVEDVVLSAAEMQQLADQDMAAARNNPGMKVAIVTDSSLLFGFARMYEAYTTGSSWETTVFYKLDDAKRWLNID